MVACHTRMFHISVHGRSRVRFLTESNKGFQISRWSSLVKCSTYNGFFVLGLTSIFNTFQSACNRGYILYDNYLMVLSRWNITDTVVWFPVRSHDSTSFCVELYPLDVEHVERLTRELQLPIWNLWFDSARNRTWASQTRIKCCATRLPCRLTYNGKFNKLKTG